MDLIHTILAMQSWPPVYTSNLLLAGPDLFGVSFFFILKFLGKILLLFAASAFISKLLKLDKAYDDPHPHKID